MRLSADEQNSTNEASINPLIQRVRGEKLFERETQFRKFEVFFDGPVGAIEKLHPVKTARF